MTIGGLLEFAEVGIVLLPIRTAAKLIRVRTPEILIIVKTVDMLELVELRLRQLWHGDLSFIRRRLL